MFNSKKTGDLLLLANGIAFVVLLNSLAALYFFRIDLTEERRYTIKPQTKELLKNLEEFFPMASKGKDFLSLVY